MKPTNMKIAIDIITTAIRYLDRCINKVFSLLFIETAKQYAMDCIQNITYQIDLNFKYKDYI
jgi:hypothetical protein